MAIYKRMLEKADTALEGYLVEQYTEALAKLFDFAKPDLRQNKSLRTRASEPASPPKPAQGLNKPSELTP
ncbi:MAG: hypothetical protein ACQKBY_05365 [Verrucomicrobiales bacterium]